MMISFDLYGILCLIVIPPVVIYLSKLAYELSQMTMRVISNEYIKKIVKQNSEVFRENIRLHNELCALLDKESIEEVQGE